MPVNSFRVSVCAGQGFMGEIPAIIREYKLSDRVWPHEPGVTVFGDQATMFAYRKYEPEYEYGGEG
jgi:hypothetical protein|tara:strand:+ start:937 stop:1134 length:198 start_codon:yes stop_codon:yes gene_type:complete